MPKQPKQEPVKIDNPGGSKIELSAPWANGLSNAGLINACTMLEALGGKPEEVAMMRTFISARSAVHREYIQQSEKTKRFGYGLSALLLAGAIVVPVLAPQGRETISWVTAAALALFAAGAFGYSKFQVKALKQSRGVEKSRSR